MEGTTLYIFTLLTLVSLTPAGQAEHVSACIHSSTQQSQEITCRQRGTHILIERVQTGYVNSTCSGNDVICPYSVSPSHPYHQNVRDTCENKTFCTVDIFVLTERFANRFRNCHSAGKTRNYVTVVYSCQPIPVPIEQTTTISSTQRPQRLFQTFPDFASFPSQRPFSLSGTAFSNPTIPPSRGSSLLRISEDTLIETTTVPLTPPTTRPSTTTSTKAIPRTSTSTSIFNFQLTDLSKIAGIFNINRSRPNLTRQSPPPSIPTDTDLEVVPTGNATEENAEVSPQNSTTASQNLFIGNNDSAVHVTSDESTKLPLSPEKSTTSILSTKVLPTNTTGNELLHEDNTGVTTPLQAAQKIQMSSKRLMTIIIPVMSILIVVIISLAVALVLVRKKQRKKATIHSKMPRPHDPAYSIASSTYDTIGDEVLYSTMGDDTYYSEPRLATSDYGSEASTPRPQSTAKKAGYVDVAHEVLSPKLSVDTNLYYEAVDADDMNYDNPDVECAVGDVYAKINKMSVTDEGEPVLIANSLYELREGAPDCPVNDDQSASSVEGDNQSIFIENDLYNTWT